ncbi:molybdopterin synthase catalytic subunit isoform X6 [Monomorium pharaonis]|uniref:molybdopterin synthase catalytic subunit isoform X6 n=1 Tax=Monomorium pharaonis TaxID=307658 RepID=UPI00063F476E|nr:molybdopterin synthase catalytic subunit isoform X6 [Monomorium pharaonis]
MDKTEIQTTILFFAKARELTGCKECKLCLPRKLSSADLFDKIVHTFELQSIRNNLILAVNEEFVTPNSTLILSEKDKIAVIPPLSGGLWPVHLLSQQLLAMCIPPEIRRFWVAIGWQSNTLPGATFSVKAGRCPRARCHSTPLSLALFSDNMEVSKNFVKLQQEELNVSEIMRLVTFPNCGAISSFIGITRDNFEDKKVIKLEYEAYESMALKEMSNICDKIRLQWNVEGIAIYHRIGNVPISKASVVIAVSSPHREESLKAVEYAINTLKASVPIWKKEIYEIGESQWKQNKECKWTNTLKKEDVQTAINEIVSNKDVIDANLIQVRANSEELNRRIESFIKRKRQQVNTMNVQEFCRYSEKSNDNENSCARVDAILIRRKDSKSHVKVHRVSNMWGPQTIDQSILRKSVALNTSFNALSSSVILDDRISATEHMIGMNKPVPKDIYERLKNIEDRILYLESISPEYKDFWIKDINNLEDISKPTRKRTYSMAELDLKLYELEDKYTKKMK